MRKDFYVFRHGETELNRQKRWQGSGMDYDLNATGVEQAQGLIAKLQDKKLQIIYSSPLLRAKHTAQVVGEALKIDVEVKNDLRECFYGQAEGQLITELQKQCPEIVNNWNKPDYWDIRFENGESKKEALLRVKKMMEELLKMPYMVMGIAIHGGTMSAMLNALHCNFDKLANCACFHLVYEDNQWRMVGDIF